MKDERNKRQVFIWGGRDQQSAREIRRQEPDAKVLNQIYGEELLSRLPKVVEEK
jgi:hypothetical protein